MLAKTTVCLLFLALGVVLCEESQKLNKVAKNDEAQVRQHRQPPAEATLHKKRRGNVSNKIDSTKRHYPPYYPYPYLPPPYPSAPFLYPPYPLPPYIPRPPFIPPPPPVRPMWPPRPSTTPPPTTTPTQTPPAAEFCEVVAFLCNPGDTAIPVLPDQFCTLFEPSCRQSNGLEEESLILPWLCAMFPSHWMCPGGVGPTDAFCAKHPNHWACKSGDTATPIERPEAIQWICDNFPTDPPQWQCVDPVTPSAGFCTSYPTHWACLKRHTAKASAMQRPPGLDAICQMLPDFWMCQSPVMPPADFCSDNPNSWLCQAQAQSGPAICAQIPGICDVLPITNGQQRQFNGTLPAVLLVKPSSETEPTSIEGPQYYPTVNVPADVYPLPLQANAGLGTSRSSNSKPALKTSEFKRPLRRAPLTKAAQKLQSW